ncbi:Alkylmercury lyase [Actinacidiphila glaucinigra]|uniref:Alkylmercury lyase n=2 Tax=Actinacidiphila glaucinigra TaxID=235986 RepID=A0A239NYM6_9ACTN|nr:Alkylmercury lyase [Actinacidiphila glaucinigra]
MLAVRVLQRRVGKIPCAIPCGMGCTMPCIILCTGLTVCGVFLLVSGGFWMGGWFGFPCVGLFVGGCGVVAGGVQGLSLGWRGPWGGAALALGVGEAARWGMTGSPTVLLDGIDPFAVAGAAPSVSCRLYLGEDGTRDGAPSVASLREVLAAVGLAEASGEDCCEADVLDPIGRAGRGRLAPCERGLRVVHQAVLRHFAATGHAPDLDALEPAAATAGRSAADVLAELACEDFLTLDQDGQIRAAYPFSAVLTPHRVRIEGGADVWSMCAIDALGIPAMLAADAEIISSDPVTGEAVTVVSRGGRMAWQPASAVVFVGRRCCAGPAAEVCCDVLNFFTDNASAKAWAHEHPDVSGQIVSQARAQEIGQLSFGPLLR